MMDGERVKGGNGRQTATLARFVSGLTFEAIPSPVVEHTKLCVLDTIGCGLFGSTLPWPRILMEAVGGHDGKAEASVWGTDRMLSLPHAVLVNGTMIHGFELDDLHKKSIVHPGSVVVSTALALAEQLGGVSGKHCLTAIVAGYEVGARVGESTGVSHLRRGYHPTGTHGAVAAAAAAANILGLSSEQTVDALSAGASQAAGLMSAQFGSMVKRLHAGRAAQSGTYAALLAQCGFAGIEDVFENSYGGYCSTLSDEPDLTQLTDGLGEVWETERVGFKWYAACGSCHTGIDALLRLRRVEGLTADQVETVRIRCSSATQEHVGWAYAPKSVTTAQMNLPYCAAVALLDGDVFVEQFSEERLRDPAVLSLTKRVRVEADPNIDAEGPSSRHKVKVEVHTQAGKTHAVTVESAKGSDTHPLSLNQVLEKFHRLAGKVMAPAETDRLKTAIFTMETGRSEDVTTRLRLAGRESRSA